MTKEEAYKTLKENLCAMCAYGSQNMESCDIRSCDNRDAIKVLEQEKPETVTEFADRCRECGAKNGKMLNDGWIPVSKKLPKENKTVIASTDYCVYPEARYTEKCGWEGAYESGADYWVKIKDIIAWMPFPKHYEPQGGGEV